MLYEWFLMLIVVTTDNHTECGGAHAGVTPEYIGGIVGWGLLFTVLTAVAITLCPGPKPKLLKP